MYYEEKIIEGIMFSRNHPDATFTQILSTKMTADLLNARAEISRLRDTVEQLSAELRDACSV